MDLLKKLPSLEGKTKKELLETLLREEYGYLPSAPCEFSAEIVKTYKNFAAGSALLETIILTLTGEWGRFSFPVYFAYPKCKDKKHPAFVHVNFRDHVPDMSQPTEEILDRGYATLTFCYKDVTSDDGDFTNGFAGVVYKNGERDEHASGKIGLWAWAAMRVMDYAMTRDELDHSRISVTGHSRLGKTALLAGALDERFYCAFSNNSGCSGAALARENTGETVAKICDRFPFWFNKHYLQYADHEEEMPFDQHFLIAANYPHRVYVASAEGDAWACPPNELLSCRAASAFYKANGGLGFLGDESLVASAGNVSHEGDIGYHCRAGSHYQSRHDWNLYIDYLQKVENKQ